MILIGIDPGTKTGVAVWDNECGYFHEITTTGIFKALQMVLRMATYETAHLFIEDPNTWKPFGKDATNKLQGAGSIKRDFAIWKEFCEDHNISMTPIKLQGTAKKLKADFFQQLTKHKGRTDQHGRDAAMLVFNRKAN